MQNMPNTIKGLADKYGVNLDNIYYKTSKKNYSSNKIKNEIFEIKYGSGKHYENYFNYFLPRIVKARKLTNLKIEFFSDYKLSNQLNYKIISNIWEQIMKIYLNL